MLLAVAVFASAVGVSCSWAQGTNPPENSRQNAVTVEELQMERAIQQREQFQQLQQLNRQQDRNDLRYRPERLQVPVIRPSCRSSVYGSSISAGCR